MNCSAPPVRHVKMEKFRCVLFPRAQQEKLFFALFVTGLNPLPITAEVNALAAQASSQLIITLNRLNRCSLINLGYMGDVALHDYTGRPYADAMCRSEDDSEFIDLELRGNLSQCAFRITVSEVMSISAE